jgi:hypothetical protein
MPYTHQWRRSPSLDPDGFAKAVEDVKLILEKIEELGIKIAGPTGHGRPEITRNTIAFNGVKECGHRFFNYGEPWPTDDAAGVFNDVPQFKPYDLAVTAALIRLKEHLADEIFINSDGHEKAFEDAKRFCRELFGWPRHFQVEPVESEVV